MVEKFTGQEQDERFKNWHLNNTGGFYLNQREQRAVMMHKVGCFHHGSGEGFNSTTKFKIGDAGREGLEAWANKESYKVVYCGHCKP